MLCDAINECTDAISTGATREEREALREERKALQETMGRVHDGLRARADAAIDTAPVVRTMAANGRIAAMQSAGGGGRIRYSSPGDADYQRHLAAINDERSMIERIFAATGETPTACRMDQYGEDANATVRLTLLDMVIVANRRGDVIDSAEVRSVTLGTSTHARGYVVTRRLRDRKYWSAVPFDGSFGGDHENRAAALAAVS